MPSLPRQQAEIYGEAGTVATEPWQSVLRLKNQPMIPAPTNDAAKEPRKDGTL
jgi:hypothetical protein